MSLRHLPCRFNINLQVGPNVDPRDNSALHISIRPREGLIVRNTYQFQSWGVEERFGGCPVQKRSYFDVSITVKPDSYGIAVNGCHFCDFNHRMPYASVRFIHTVQQKRSFLHFLLCTLDERHYELLGFKSLMGPFRYLCLISKFKSFDRLHKKLCESSNELLPTSSIDQTSFFQQNRSLLG
ncbi:AGAP013132-PA [Anopheles gambiae str. PEST]|uniref:Galectin n=2 Tax=gambiae species complex TaxID=44542 RepID=F5HLS8_ANOGA|nr:AGAP013132-PA [Anopheles gambiae str. PEST]